MIGKIIIGKSFRGCISYCLEDKLANEAKKHRAEVLHYNLCYGNKSELIRQFTEVRNLNQKLSRPVLHLTLSSAPREHLKNNQLVRLAQDCAKELGFEKNQYITISHNDTHHQHIHMVVNRVGLDGKTWSDSNNYKRIAKFCRKAELDYHLTAVLSPKKFLNQEQKQIPRLDQRKRVLQTHIRDSLHSAKNYTDFEKKMGQKGYEIIRARGIRFIDPQKVKTKGSEVGYSLQTIEKLLSFDLLKRRLILRMKEEGFDKDRLSAPQHAEQQREAIETNKEISSSKQEQSKNQNLTDIVVNSVKTWSPSKAPLLIKKRKQKKRSQHL